MIWKLSTLYTSTGITVSFLLNAPKSLAATPPLPTSTNNSSLAVITNSTSDIDGKNLHCIDLADFFYDIILALSSFPTAMCNHKEEKEISRFLTQKINQVMKNTPGTLQTKNKICNKAINSRRQRYLIHQEQKEEDQLNENYSQLFHSEATDHHRKLSTYTPRRSFIYVGGGRCRFCFYDNLDFRQRRQLALFNHEGTRNRDLLNYKLDEDDDDSPPKIEKVADPSLCQRGQTELVYSSKGDERSYKSWKDVNVSAITGLSQLSNKDRHRRFLGPYVAGDSFSRDFDLTQKKPNAIMTVKKVRPVRGVTIGFLMRAFDIPDKYTKEIIDDEPVLIFVNGIKFDFNVMMSAPGAQKIVSDDEIYFRGKFVGISWTVDDLGGGSKNIGYGPEKDRTYSVSLNLPSIIFSNHNKINVQFMIKPEAKAKFYGLDHLGVYVSIADCEITGLETSPFDEFKEVMEIRLRKQLGVGLLDKFQNQAGHCLENKIPKVDVHLVQKERWRDANPRCITANGRL